jgi:hypothetical protein
MIFFLNKIGKTSVMEIKPNRSTIELSVDLSMIDDNGLDIKPQYMLISKNGAKNDNKWVDIEYKKDFGYRVYVENIKDITHVGARTIVNGVKQ